MAIATIACPKCNKTFRGNEEVKNKRIRCPACGVGFVVKEFVAGGAAPAKAKPKSEPAPEEKEEENPDDDANPYGVGTVSIAARCPNCANEMESEAAIICLYCGYNTQTRTLGQTTRTVQQTGSDRIKWLMPGIGCFFGLLLLVLFQNYYTLNLAASFRTEDGWLWSMLSSEPLFLWLTLISAAVLWIIGRFVFKRLILEPKPPESIAE
jgi:DNA-directed RNA polymerase subunit RPC12/RpoP